MINDDILLISRIRNGDIDAFEMLYHQYKKKLYNFSLRYLDENTEAEDVVQQVFINLWEHRESLDESLSVKSYIYKSAVNNIYNLLKKRAICARYVEYELQKSRQLSNQTYDQVLFDDLENTIKAIVTTLPLQQQKIFNLSRFDGFSHEDIAKKLEISVRTVENQIYRVIKIIKKQLCNV